VVDDVFNGGNFYFFDGVNLFFDGENCHIFDGVNFFFDGENLHIFDGVNLFVEGENLFVYGEIFYIFDEGNMLVDGENFDMNSIGVGIEVVGGGNSVGRFGKNGVGIYRRGRWDKILFGRNEYAGVSIFGRRHFGKKFDCIL